MTWQDSDRPRARPDIGERIIEGEALLVDADGGQILVLNEVGAFTWQLLDGAHDVAAVVTRVLDEFDVDAATARVDVLAFLTALHERGALAP
jgi:hypothetical protein